MGEYSPIRRGGRAPAGCQTRRLGVEEELLLVDPDSGAAKAVGEQVMELYGEADGFQTELQAEQLEIATRPCAQLEELAEQVRASRAALSRRAREVGAEVAALATSPVPVDPTLSRSRRYERMAETFGLTTREQLSCGCHVHVEVASQEEGAAVIDRIRPWLAPLIALSANSPYWQGRDSGYASYRYQMWNRWPTAGPTELFGSSKAYHSLVCELLRTGTLLDEGMVYFDARLSHHLPTVEIRVADVCLEADDAVLVAALARGLVETAAREWRAGRPPDPVSAQVLRLAAWRASRFGLDGRLLHPLTHTPAPAAEVVRTLLRHVRRTLSQDDAMTCERLLDQLLSRGTGAGVQRAAYAARGCLADVSRAAVARTTAR
nr:glutamate--cysteine ligase [Streptomyces sp. RPT161]